MILKAVALALAQGISYAVRERPFGPIALGFGSESGK